MPISLLRSGPWLGAVVVFGFAAATAPTLVGGASGTQRPAEGQAESQEDDADDTPPAVAAPVSATTHLTYCQANYEFLRERIVDVYEATSADPPEVRRRAAEWLDTIARADADLGGAPTWGEIYRQGDTLLEAGCEHPIVVGYAAQFDMLRGRLERSRARHDQSSPTLLAGEYGALPRYQTAVRLARLYSLLDWERRNEYVLLSGEALLDVAAAEEADQSDNLRQRVLWSYFSYLVDNGVNREQVTSLLNTVAGDEHLSPWLRAIAEGAVAYKKAWWARGGGYASEVEEEKWETFYNEIAAAKAAYEKAHDLEPDHPESAAELVAISNSEPNADIENIRFWFDEARRAQSDYLPAYEYLLWASLPQWHGSYEQMYQLAQQWYAEGQHDTNAPWMAAKAVFDIGRWTGGWAQPLKTEGPYTLVMSAFQTMADSPGHDASVRRGFSRAELLTHVACTAFWGDHQEEAINALRTLEEEGLEIDAKTMRQYDMQPEVQVPRLYARWGKAAEQVSALAELTDEERQGDRAALTRTIEAYQQAKLATDDPRTDPYFDHWIAHYSMQRNLLDGDWAAPKFDAPFTEWYRPVEGLWEVESPTSAVARRSDVSGYPQLWASPNLGDSFEVEFDMEPLFESGKGAWNGLYVQADGEDCVFFLNRHLPGCGVTEDMECTTFYPIHVKDRYHVAVRVWPGYGELWIEGHKYFGVELADFQPTGNFALGSKPGLAHGSEVRYSNVRFRKLPPRNETEAGVVEADEDPTSDDSAVED